MKAEKRGIHANTCALHACIHYGEKVEDQISPPPRDMEEWKAERAENRGISLEEIL